MADTWVVALRPSLGHDGLDPLKYTHYWLGNVLEFARSKGMKTLDFHDDLASWESFAPTLRTIISSGEPFYLLGSGHGVGDRLTGQRLAPVFDTGIQGDFSRSAAYFWSCKTARSLGPHLVNNGLASFVGFTEDYIVGMDSPGSAPQHDQLSRADMEIATAIPITMISGGSVSNALENARRIGEQWWTYYRGIALRGDRNQRYLAENSMARIEWNLNALVAVGRDITIVQPEKRVEMDSTFATQTFK